MQGVEVEGRWTDIESQQVTGEECVQLRKKKMGRPQRRYSWNKYGHIVPAVTLLW